MNIELDKNLPDLVAHIPGKVYLVGGAVISHLLDTPIIDWDFEVYGVSYESVVNSLVSAGYHTMIIDGRWGVIKVQDGDIEVDISLPRVDNKVGKGHGGFDVTLCPELSTYDAASRRDLTINALMLDIESGQLLDHFGGISHLEEGLLKHVNSSTFVEDPLRVFRVAQLLSRKGKSVHPDTIELCRSIRESAPELIGTTCIFCELRKLMNSHRPSLGLQFLMDCGWMKTLFPQIAALSDCAENLRYHPEGTTWRHTLLAVDKAVEYRDGLGEWSLGYMFAMLLHDVGKPDVIDENGRAYGHDKIGADIAKDIMISLRAPNVVIDQVYLLVKYHMRINLLWSDSAKKGAWKRLQTKVPLGVLAYVARADSLGREKAGNKHPASDYALSFGEEEKPVLLGRHLIQDGYTPGREFGRVLDTIFQYQLDTGIIEVEHLLTEARRIMDA